MLTKEEVLRIAKLSRLELTENEVKLMQKDLSEILDYFNLLKNLDTSKIKLEKEDILPIEKITRKDEVAFQKCELNDNLIGSAMNRKDEYIKIKTVL